jgi:hypothetical protein
VEATGAGGMLDARAGGSDEAGSDALQGGGSDDGARDGGSPPMGAAKLGGSESPAGGLDARSGGGGVLASGCGSSWRVISSA